MEIACFAAVHGWNVPLNRSCRKRGSSPTPGGVTRRFHHESRRAKQKNGGPTFETKTMSFCFYPSGHASMKAKYVLTNLTACDWRKLARFYSEVFGCVPKLPERDISGAW